MSQTPGSAEPFEGLDLDSVIQADLEAEYSVALEREFQRVFLGDVENWHPTGLLQVLGGDDDE